jgi:hypothetical protein
VDLLCESAGGGKVRVRVLEDDELVYMDTINPASAFQRQRFAKALAERVPEVKPEVIEAELLRFADAPLAGDEAPADAAAAAAAGEEPAELLARMPAEVRDEANGMLADPMLIKTVVEDVAALGVAGERELTGTIYLVGVSRLLEQPLAAIVQGPSSSGKSFVIERTAELFPAEAVIQATQMTSQALFHMKPGTLVHRFIVGGERSRAEDDEWAEATRALREMLSSGKLTKLMPVKVEGGRIETVLIEQAGPIAFIESTTLTRIFDEDPNRCSILHTDEQPEQTRRILKSLSADYSGKTGGGTVERTVQRHHALQRMLKPMPVVIPVAERLGELFVSYRVEARRAFPQLISMIQAIALLHQCQRPTNCDGQLVATAEDYHLARRLMTKPLSRLLSGKVSDPARRFYDRLSNWVRGEFTSKEAKSHETGSKSAVYGWLTELYEAGIIEMVEAPRGRSPARWRLTSTVPEDALSFGLPTVEDVFPGQTRTHGSNPEPVGTT